MASIRKRSAPADSPPNSDSTPSVARILPRTKRSSAPTPAFKLNVSAATKPNAQAASVRTRSSRSSDLLLTTPRRSARRSQLDADHTQLSVADLLRKKTNSKRIRPNSLPAHQLQSVSDGHVNIRTLLESASPAPKTITTKDVESRPPAYLRFKHLLAPQPQATFTPSESPTEAPISNTASASTPLQETQSQLSTQPQTSGLRPLPTSLITLIRIFDAIENVLGFLDSRGQPCIYIKIRKAVETQCGRTFTLKHLAQIVYIYPEAYMLQSVRTVFGGECVSSVSISVAVRDDDVVRERNVYEALVNPIAAARLSFPPKKGDLICTSSTTQPDQENNSISKSLIRTSSVVHSGTLSQKPIRAVDDAGSLRSLVQAASTMATRRQIFRSRLESWVAKAHAKFLQDRGMNVVDYITSCYEDENNDVMEVSESSRRSLSLMDRRRLSMSTDVPLSWHSEFNLDSVSEIPEAVLPKPELTHLDRIKIQAGIRLPGIHAAPSVSVFGGSLKERIDAKLRERQAAKAATISAVESGEETKPDSDELNLNTNGIEVSKNCSEISKNPELNSKPKSRAASILERVREKQRLRAEAAVSDKQIDTKVLYEISMMKKMPAAAQSLCLFCVSLGRMTLPLASASAHVSASLERRSVRDGGCRLSHADAEKLLRMLAEKCPKFCEILEPAVIGGGMVRISRSIKLHSKTSEEVRRMVDEFEQASR